MKPLETARMVYRHPHPRSTGETDLAAHTGQWCEVLTELGDDERDEEVGRMFHVRFDDGFESDVFLHELGTP